MIWRKLAFWFLYASLVTPPVLAQQPTLGNVGGTVPPSGGFPTPPGNAYTILHMESQAWTVCNANTGCHAGTPNCQGTATISTPTTNPFGNGQAALKFVNTTNPGSPEGCNTLLYHHFGKGPFGVWALGAITNALYEFDFYWTPSSGGVFGVEFDPDIFLNNTWTIKASLACYTDLGGVWAVYNQAIQNWVHTTTPCSMNGTGANKKHHIKYWVTYNLTATQPTYTFQRTEVDGVAQWTPTAPPNTGSTFNAWLHPFGSDLNAEVQIDNKQGAGTSTAWYQNFTMTVWGN